MRVAVAIACCIAFGAVGYLAFARSAPPTPVFTRTPAARTEDRSAAFAYRVALRHPRFRCSLDGGRWVRCRARFRVAGLAEGRHRFCVRARAGSRRSQTACYAWSVGSPAAFRMTAAATAPLLPGAPAVPVDIAFTNPGSSAITVTAVDLAVDGGEPAGCARYVRVVGQLAARPVIPPTSTRTLSELAIPTALWPQLAMVDDGTDQNACRQATIRLALTGSASG